MLIPTLPFKVVCPVTIKVPSVEMLLPIVVARTMAAVAKVVINMAKTVCRVSFDLSIDFVVLILNNKKGQP